VSGPESLRVDVLLHRLCLTRSRSEAKAACDSGAVLVNGAVARASREVTAGSTVTIHFPRRSLELEVQTLPGKSTSRKLARELYRVVRDEPAGDLA
jgi:ribosomal 50S subunit-recycling heat shock protein